MNQNGRRQLNLSLDRMAEFFDLGDPLSVIGVIVELPFLDLGNRDVLLAEAAQLVDGAKDPVEVSPSCRDGGQAAPLRSAPPSSTTWRPFPMLAQSTGSM
ncbi:hypothetical protein ACGFIE_25110 [Micromonospora sp. NPDC049275]|uniref:hypothetical protein n=1 Tax=Micromonospora sp. NPDC049275 TaxID=3364268 RepID=UPI0037111DCD